MSTCQILITTLDCLHFSTLLCWNPSVRRFNFVMWNLTNPCLLHQLISTLCPCCHHRHALWLLIMFESGHWRLKRKSLVCKLPPRLPSHRRLRNVCCLLCLSQHRRRQHLRRKCLTRAYFARPLLHTHHSQILPLLLNPRSHRRLKYPLTPLLHQQLLLPRHQAMHWSL